jgi:hypothetical protein
MAYFLEKEPLTGKNIKDELLRYSKQLRHARKRYRQFIEKALTLGKRPEFSGGGLVRGMGGLGCS